MTGLVSATTIIRAGLSTQAAGAPGCLESGFGIPLNVRHRVRKVQAVSAEEGVDIQPVVKTEKTPHGGFAQTPAPISLESECFDGGARGILIRGDYAENAVGDVDGDVHASLF